MVTFTSVSIDAPATRIAALPFSIAWARLPGKLVHGSVSKT